MSFLFIVTVITDVFNIFSVEMYANTEGFINVNVLYCYISWVIQFFLNFVRFFKDQFILYFYNLTISINFFVYKVNIIIQVINNTAGNALESLQESYNLIFVLEMVHHLVVIMGKYCVVGLFFGLIVYMMQLYSTKDTIHKKSSIFTFIYFITKVVCGICLLGFMISFYHLIILFS